MSERRRNEGGEPDLEAIELNEHEAALAAQVRDANRRSLEDHDY
jgi:hypothetical protein